MSDVPTSEPAGHLDLAGGDATMRGFTPEETQPYAGLHETHAGVVLLLGPVAYKLKKPVRLPFLDFSTAALRRDACRRELDLNRRLAPDVYLGLGSLQAADGSVEPMVMMKRMPDRRRLSYLVAADAVDEGEIRAIARLIAVFHTHAQRGAAIDEEGRRDRVRRRWRRNLDETEQLSDCPVPAATIARVREYSERYLEGRSALFDARIGQGRIVDGHGDLLADDIFCLDDGPRVLDCLDFDDHLRYLDQLDDIACLAMDLERLGRPDLAADLLTWYRRFSGDPAPASLAHHYVAYRAFMRAKVAAVRHSQAHYRHTDEADDPRALADLALEHLRAGTVRLVLVGGAPGAGKSTLAEAVADRIDATVLSSDRTRKELAGIAPHQPAGAPFEEGIYAPAWTTRTYAELLARAERLLAGGESVILDASWREPGHRALAAQLATRTTADLHQLRCTLPAVLAAQRMQRRQGVSDADAHIAAAIRRLESPWPGSVPIDTSLAPAAAAESAAAVLLSGAGTGPHDLRPLPPVDDPVHPGA